MNRAVLPDELLLRLKGAQKTAVRHGACQSDNACRNRSQYRAKPRCGSTPAKANLLPAYTVEAEASGATRDPGLRNAAPPGPSHIHEVR